MALKQRYPGQQVGDTAPDVVITHDPAVDRAVLRAAHYAAGKIMTLINSATAGRGAVIVPMNGAAASGHLAYGTLINGCGNEAESIGPSGSGMMPVVRAMPIFDLTNDPIEEACFEATPTLAYAIGLPLYCGDGTVAPLGTWTTDKATGAVALGICHHVPTNAEPWLGVTQLY